MIAAIALGALLGAALFLVVLQLSPPKTSPLVQLAQLDAAACHRAPPRPTAPVAVAAGGRWSGLPVRSRAGSWLARSTHPPRHHLHQPAAGPGPDRPHLRAGA